MTEFVALNVSSRKSFQSDVAGCFTPTNTIITQRPAVALGRSKALEDSVLKKEEASSQKSVMLFARFVDFVRVLSAPEICFLMVVISKTNYGALTEVPIPRSDIIQNQAIPSLAIKQIREKLAAMGLIAVTQKRLGRGSESWVYSLCCGKLNSMLYGKEPRGA